MRYAYITPGLVLKYQPHACVAYHYAQPVAGKIVHRPKAVEQFYRDAGEVIVERL